MKNWFNNFANYDFKVSKIGLGTVKFGRNSSVKYPNSFNLPSDKEIQELLNLSFENGINLLDTAPAYGLSELRIGKNLNNRQNWIICTKTGENFENNKSSFNFSYQHTIKSIEQSLRNLRTDYLDIVLVHSNGENEEIIQEDTFAALQDLKQKGLIRSFGFSGKTLQGNLTSLTNGDCAMIEYNSTNTSQEKVIEVAKQKNKSVFIKKAFGSGHLSVKDELNFILKQDITSVVIGSINKQHLLDNINNCKELLKSN